MSRDRWALVGLLGGGAVGVFWGLAGGDVERGDSAIGTGLLCAVAGVLLVVIVDGARAVATRRRKGGRAGERPEGRAR